MTKAQLFESDLFTVKGTAGVFQFKKSNDAFPLGRLVSACNINYICDVIGLSDTEIQCRGSLFGKEIHTTISLLECEEQNK